MESQNKRIEIADGFDDLAVRAEQLYALSRVIEDASEKPDRDDRAIQGSLWLLSSLLGENYTSIVELQKKYLRDKETTDIG